MVFAVLYAVIVFVCYIVLRVIDDTDDESARLIAWFSSIFWPFLIACAVTYAVIYLPLSLLGRGIDKIARAVRTMIRGSDRRKNKNKGVKRMYIRKTVDRWDIETNYGYGWETEVSEYTWKEAKQTKREYAENASGLIGIRIVKRRERIGGKAEK